MKIEIKRRFDDSIMISCEKCKKCRKNEERSLKLCVEKNKDANLVGANLDRASLVGANLDRANLDRASLVGANLDRASLVGANLVDANLDHANLDHANLADVNLYHANLDRANLDGIKNYNMSHDIIIQIGKNNLDKFTIRQQEISSRIFTLRLCWTEIKKQYGKYMTAIFKIIADLGWDEYLKKWEEVKKEKCN